MGRVWLAADEILHRPVALKQVILSGLGSAELRATARECAPREARAAARVDHVGAIRILEVVKDDGCPRIVMEPLSGRTLEEALNASGPLPIDRVTRVGLCLLDVLRATHRAGVVHRDVKPSNVHLCDGGRVVLTDFGIACTMDDADSATDTFVGSPAYISPERLGGREFGPASDLLSLGATLFTAVEGQRALRSGLAVRHARRRCRRRAGTVRARGSAASGHRRAARQGSRTAAVCRPSPHRALGYPSRAAASARIQIADVPPVQAHSSAVARVGEYGVTSPGTMIPSGVDASSPGMANSKIRTIVAAARRYGQRQTRLPAGCNRGLGATGHLW
jgi:serine/threonine protein kinase